MSRFSWACMPNFIALGCLEVGEKFLVGWWGGLVVFWGISIPTTKLHQPEVGLGLSNQLCLLVSIKELRYVEILNSVAFCWWVVVLTPQK